MALIALAPPPAGTPFAAYAPIIFRCADVIAGTSGYVPAEVVYCDVYLVGGEGGYYKSISATSGELFYFGSAPWYRAFEFDVQSILQEALRSIPPPLDAFTLVSDSNALRGFKLAFRKGYKNAAGVVVFNDAKPVQRTLDTPSVEGGGVFTSNYRVLNATLQHEEEEELSVHLATLRQPAATNPKVWPLSSRPNRSYLVGREQPDFFPFFCGANAFSDLDPNGGIEDCSYQISYKNYGDGNTYANTTQGTVTAAVLLNGNAMYHLPVGIVQLRQLSWFFPITWDKMVEYQVSIIKGEDKIVVTPWITVDSGCKEGQRIMFLNRYGGWDGINFNLIDETQQVKSESWEKRRTPFRFYNSETLQTRKSDYGNARFNVRSNERIQARTHKYPYSANQWLKEIFGAPIGYLQGKIINTAKQTLFPIAITDADFPVKKSGDRWDNMVMLEYAPANENNHQRL